MPAMPLQAACFHAALSMPSAGRQLYWVLFTFSSKVRRTYKQCEDEIVAGELIEMSDNAAEMLDSIKETA